MKREKDSRINAFNASVKLYLLIFFMLAIFNAAQTHFFWLFIKNGILETHIHIVIVSRALFVLTFTAVLTAIFGIFREFLLVNPMRKLGDAARQIAKGNFSVRVVPRRKDGKKDFIEVLFDDFNSMTEELAVANEKLKALSVTDELTKLDNRRSFLEYIDLVWKQNHRLNLPVTVIMIDIDYFKKYNDSLGHLEGDNALVAIAKCLKNNIRRETDFVARFGGEEFVCVLPFIEKDEALEFAKTLVQSVENLQIPHPMSLHSKYVTISVGMASAVPNDNNSHIQLLEEADKALYSAKESGRNKVVMN
jgi:diguanylate cyclase (GGDEF)-like protein